MLQLDDSIHPFVLDRERKEGGWNEWKLCRPVGGTDVCELTVHTVGFLHSFFHFFSRKQQPRSLGGRGGAPN